MGEIGRFAKAPDPLLPRVDVVRTPMLPSTWSSSSAVCLSGMGESNGWHLERASNWNSSLSFRSESSSTKGSRHGMLPIEFDLRDRLRGGDAFPSRGDSESSITDTSRIDKTPFRLFGRFLVLVVDSCFALLSVMLS